MDYLIRIRNVLKIPYWNKIKVAYQLRTFSGAFTLKVVVSYLEKRGILVPVVVLFPGVFPWYPEDALFIVLPHQAGVFAAVHLLDQPLAQLPVAAAPGASVIHVEVHVWPSARSRPAQRSLWVFWKLGSVCVDPTIIGKKKVNPTGLPRRLTCRYTHPGRRSRLLPVKLETRVKFRNQSEIPHHLRCAPLNTPSRGWGAETVAEGRCWGGCTWRSSREAYQQRARRGTMSRKTPGETLPASGRSVTHTRTRGNSQTKRILWNDKALLKAPVKWSRAVEKHPCVPMEDTRDNEGSFSENVR